MKAWALCMASGNHPVVLFVTNDLALSSLSVLPVAPLPIHPGQTACEWVQPPSLDGKDTILIAGGSSHVRR